MSGAEAQAPVETVDQVSQSNFIANFLRTPQRKVALGAAVFAAGIGGAFELGKNHADKGLETPVAAAQAIGASACASFQSIEAGTNNSQLFNAESFLQRAGNVTDSESTRNYVNKLFTKEGVIAGGNVESLAAIMATVVVPAEKGTVNDPNYDYVKTFNDKVAAYNHGGEKVASQDCQKAYDILTQVSGYNDSWARAGEHVSEFRAIRNGSYDLVGAELTKPQVVQSTMEGIEMVLRTTTKGKNGEQLQGFASVLIDKEGKLWVKGLKPTQAGKSAIQHGNHPNHMRAHRQEQQNQNQQQQQQHRGGGGGVQGVRPHGHEKQNQAGPNEQNKPGQKPVTTGKPHPTPAGGGTTTAPTKTTPTQTETTPPSTTQTTPPTETTPPPTTTTTQTTPPPKPPAPCDPNAGEVCP